jgi:xanthine dehydrogenase/oxidase
MVRFDFLMFTGGTFANDRLGWADTHKPLGPDDTHPQMIWITMIGSAYMQRVDLSAEGFYTNPFFNANPSTSMPQVYGYVYASAYSEVEIDVITGNTTIIETRLLVDAGKSMNPAVDVGQIEGAFLQGVGTVLTETVLFQPDGDRIGTMTADNTWVYKPPFAKDLPLNWSTTIFPSDQYPVPLNPHAPLSSKAMGEPPFILATSVYCAVKEAIYAARMENGLGDEWFMLPTPVTPQEVKQYAGAKFADFKLNPPTAAARAVPLATDKFKSREKNLTTSAPLPVSALASLNKNATICGNKAKLVNQGVTDAGLFRAAASVFHK